MYGGITCDIVFITVSCPVPLEEPLTAIDLSKVPDGTLGKNK